MYKIMDRLVNIIPTAGLLEPRNHSSRGHKYQLQVPKLQNRQMPAFILPISNSTLELCPHRCSISQDSACLQNCTNRLNGRMCLIAIGISEFSNLFLTVSLTKQFFSAFNLGKQFLNYSPCTFTVVSVPQKKVKYTFISKLSGCNTNTCIVSCVCTICVCFTPTHTHNVFVCV